MQPMVPQSLGARPPPPSYRAFFRPRLALSEPDAKALAKHQSGFAKTLFPGKSPAYKTECEISGLAPLHRDFDSFSPHGEERGQRPRVSNHGRACGAARERDFLQS